MDKDQLAKLLVNELSKELEAVSASAAAAYEGATHEEAKPENEYDTRGLEQSYLAGAQAARAEALAASIAKIEDMGLAALGEGAPIAIGAVVRLNDGEGTELYFLCPDGGGAKLQVGPAIVRVITPSSPLGQALLGKTTGDVIELTLAGRARELEIEDVH